MYTNPVSTLLVYLHIAVSCVGMLSRVRYILSGRVVRPKVKIPMQGGPRCCTSLVSPVGVYICISTCLQVHQSTVYSGCTGWSLLQGPPHRSSHGRNGGLPGVTPPPPPQLPALSFSKGVYLLVRFSN